MAEPSDPRQVSAEMSLIVTVISDGCTMANSVEISHSFASETVRE